MAELRTIQHTRVENINALHPLLALSDQFSLIPHPLSSLKILSSIEDSFILIIGPTGLFYVSYRLLEQVPIHFLEAANDLEESSQLLAEFLENAEDEHPLPINLFLLVDDGNIEGAATDSVFFVPEGQLVNRIQNQPQVLSEEELSVILEKLKADNTFERVFCYQILSELKQQHNEVDYLAIDTINEQLVKLKELQMPYHPEHLERNSLVRGAKLTQDLRHENILCVEKLIPQEDKIFIVSEWCEGSITLRQYLDHAKEPIPLTIAVQMIKDLCQALIYAHEKGIIHRNINPDNLLVTPDHRLKVTNFGSAKRTGIQTLQTTDLRRLTRQNPYAAPEYLVGAYEIDQRVDVYAIGSIFYELLTGFYPKHYDENLWEPPSQVIPAIPLHMDRLVAKAIRFDRDQRYSTINAFLTAMEYGVSEKIRNRYRLLEDIGLTQAETYIIYKALDTETNTLIGLQKLLLPSKLNQKERLKVLNSLVEKTNKLMQFKHPNFLEIQDCFIEDEDFYVVLAWGDYKTLGELFLSTNRALVGEKILTDFNMQLLELAHQLFEFQIPVFYHPDYILMLPGTKYVYVGTGMFLLDSIYSEDSMRYCLAPEHYSDSLVITQQSTIFSLGLLSYQYATKRMPYEISFQRGYSEQECEPITTYQSHFSADLEYFILKSIALIPAKRFLNLSECITFLKIDRGSSEELEEESSFQINSQSIISQLGLIEYVALTCLLAIGVYLGINNLYPSFESLPVIQEVFYE